jgi:hypothetical protein
MHGKGDFMVRLKMAVVMAVAGGVLAGGLAMPTAASASTASGTIANWGSGLCLDVGHYGNLYENGVRIQQWGCGTDSRQVWHLNLAVNPNNLKLGYEIVNGASGKCLDVTNGKDADRTPVQQWDCRYHFAASQFWYAEPSVPGRIVSAIGGRCLEVAGGSLVEGAYLQTYHCTSNNPAQIFVLG